MSAVIDSYRLTPMQEGMLFQAFYAEHSGVDVEQIVCRLRESLDVPNLLRAWEHVVARHPAFRTAFRWSDVEQPLQQVVARVDVPFQESDWRMLSGAEQEAQLASFLDSDRREGFDLSKPPLLRLALFRTAESEYSLVWTFHHLVADGRSHLLALDEAFAAYKLFRSGGTLELPPPAELFRDHVESLPQREREGDEAFWRQLVGDFSEPTSLTPSASITAATRFATLRAEIPEALTGRLRRIASENELTLNTFLQGAWALVLSRYSARQDVVFGAVRAGRPSLADSAGTVGNYINTVPIRMTCSSETTLRTFLATLRSLNLSLRDHETTPLVRVQRWSGVPFGTPLFDSLLVYDDFRLQSALRRRSPEWSQRDVELHERTNFPFTLYGYGEASLHLKLLYAEDRLSATMAARVLSLLGRLLEAMAAGLDQPLSELPVVSDADRHDLSRWNETARPYAKACIHHLFEDQCERTPEAVALVFGDQQLSYSALDAQASRLARRLERIGVGPEVPVGVYLPRCPDMLVAVLAILKAGGCYLPLDPSYPPQRIAFMVADAEARLVLSKTDLVIDFPGAGVQLLAIDDLSDLLDESDPNVARVVGPENLAYVIYTSGSTGEPKGVMVSHANVTNLFSAMDDAIPQDGPRVWLAATSLSFDISVLELLWTLTRGFEVVLASGSWGPHAPQGQEIEFSLFYFASDESEPGVRDKYRLLLEGARFADENGFAAVWTPERHFHAFGGLYPSPAVASAAIAAVTKRVAIRAGSCVLPLHDPVRVAEEWALVDNLSGGRVGVSFASGWHANDFVLKPENFADRNAIMARDIDVVRRLWRGESLRLPGPDGRVVELRTLPRPLQPELPVWITAAGSPATFRMAGERGFKLLTHLLGQTPDELGEKLAIYRAAWTAKGHPGTGHVTLMLHTFVGDDIESVRETVREPMKQYLRSSVDLIKRSLRSFPALRQRADGTRPPASQDLDLADLSADQADALLDFAFERYFETSGLFGTPESCAARIQRLQSLGVEEVACLIDFGVPSEQVLAHLEQLKELKRRCTARGPSASSWIAEEIDQHRVSHFQCTPSLVAMLLALPDARSALQRLRVLLVGGEALPSDIAEDLLQLIPDATILNMYGPTETTVWSTTHRLRQLSGPVVPIGRPIANTRMYVLDAELRPVPVGAAGELFIAGDGVARGYLKRPQLSAERFHASSLDEGLLYRTGDLARFREDGTLDFLGRVDHQIKLRGHRIELGEIEALLRERPGVREAVVAAREDQPDDQRLVAYVVPAAGAAPSVPLLREAMRERLPEFMLPATYLFLSELPRTPNGKVNRKALPPPLGAEDLVVRAKEPPRDGLEATIAAVWNSLLRAGEVGRDDNFFDLGGHSLLAVQVHRRLASAIRCDFPIAEVFRFPTVRRLAARLEEIAGPREDSARSSECLVPIKAEGSKTPFFCVHEGHGEVLSYYNLAHHLDPARPFYGVQVPDLETGRYEPVPLRELAARYVREIRELRPAGPYLIGGWCVGGDLALEMASQLHEQGARVPLVALIQTYRGQPNYRPGTSALARLAFRVVDSVGNQIEILGGLPRRMLWPHLQGRARKGLGFLRASLHKWTDAVLQRVGWRQLLYSDAYARRAAIREALQRAYHDHVPRAYGGAVALLRAHRQRRGTETDSLLGWSGLLKGAVVVQEVPGQHHGSFLWEPRVSTLARILSTCLDEAEAREAPHPPGPPRGVREDRT